MALPSYYTRCDSCDCRLLIDEVRWCAECEYTMAEDDPAEDATRFMAAAQRLAARTSLPRIFANHEDCMELLQFQEVANGVA